MGGRMKQLIHGVLTNYEVSGEGDVVLLLHGWGMDLHSMLWIGEELKCKVYAIDLPGFGESEIRQSWDVFDYVDWLRAFCEELELEDIMIVAHSFGCRIALWYSYVYGCKKMVLTGAAGIPSLKNKFQKWREMEYHISKYIYKKLGLLKRIEQLQNGRGSYDYRNASPIMKETLVKVIHNDVTGILSSIYTPTILVVGDKDDITPVWMSREMESRMQDAAMIVFEGCHHFAYLQDRYRFMKIVKVFLEKEEEHA
jgi:pimeloyl-ACP methyl ester carboxylesterase